MLSVRIGLLSMFYIYSVGFPLPSSGTLPALLTHLCSDKTFNRREWGSECAQLGDIYGRRRHPYVYGIPSSGTPYGLAPRFH